jgi:pimeloyl-ACP methyl ester carboxylesterase
LVDFFGHGLSDRPPDFAYTLEEHARTIVALIDTLGVSECGLVGHSMGGAVAVLVATARPNTVALLIMAEPSIDGGGGEPLAGQTEDEFVALGFSELLDAQAAEAEAQPRGWRAAHLGMTRLVEPRALHREAVSHERGTNPSVRWLLANLQMPRWYLHGELTEPEAGLQHDLLEMGVRWKVVPKAGHPMGVQNPLGVAQTVSEILLLASWSK